MLVFNGLYFRGTWETPFVRQKEDSFYKSDSEKSTVTIMNTEGNFRAGSVPELDSVAIELPYKVPRTQHPILITLYQIPHSYKTGNMICEI
jgi:serine protease inhibitor